MNSEAKTYYTKLHTEFNQNVKNTLTLYYNQFYRDWYKLDKVNGASLNQIVSKAYAGLNGTGNLNIYKGIAAGNIKYKSNDRQYYAYGLMNQSDFDFNTNIFNRDIKHDLKVGLNFIMIRLTEINMLTSSLKQRQVFLHQLEQLSMLIETKLQKVRPFTLKKMQQLIIL